MGVTRTFSTRRNGSSTLMIPKIWCKSILREAMLMNGSRDIQDASTSVDAYPSNMYQSDVLPVQEDGYEDLPVTRSGRGFIHLPKTSSRQPASICPRCKGVKWLRSPYPFGHPNYKSRGVPCGCLLEERRE